MTQRNILSAVSAAVLTPLVEGSEGIVIWIIVAFALILGDLRFGIMASMKRGEKIRGSRAVRRTINKMVDYICWVSIAWVLGASFGKIFGIPLLAAIIMVIVCTVELSSIFDNYFEYKGLKKRFNTWKFFSKIFKIPEIEESIEDKKED